MKRYPESVDGLEVFHDGAILRVRLNRISRKNSLTDDMVYALADLFDAVLNHHEQVQGNKPPNGKRSWFERASGGKVVVRSGYSLYEPAEDPGDYVHEYRIPTFSGFLADLGAFR